MVNFEQSSAILGLYRKRLPDNPALEKKPYSLQSSMEKGKAVDPLNFFLDPDYYSKTKRSYLFFLNKK